MKDEKIMKDEKTDMSEVAQEYLNLQEEEKRIKAKLAQLKALLTKDIELVGELKVDNKIFTFQERISYKYNPLKLRAVIGEDTAKIVIKEEVDVKKLQGLIKGGIISKESADEAREETRRVKALVIKEANND